MPNFRPIVDGNNYVMNPPFHYLMEGDVPLQDLVSPRSHLRMKHLRCTIAHENIGQTAVRSQQLFVHRKLLRAYWYCCHVSILLDF